MRRLALLLALAPAAAHADFWDLYGMTPRALGMANCHVAVTDDFSAVFYNPAALASARSSGYGVLFASSFPALDVSFEKTPPAIPAAEPAPASALGFGTQFTLAGERGANRLALGLAFTLPTRSLLSGRALDPAIPQWYLYNAFPERISFAVALGARPFDWLSLGAGIQVLAGLSGELDYELDIVAGRFSKKTVTFDIEPRGAPLVGIELRPIQNLRLGATWRGPIQTDVDLPVNLEITGIAELRVDTRFLVQYSPHELAFGASYLFEELGLLVSAELQWSAWSGAPDPSVDSRIDAGGDLLEGTGLADALDTPAPGQSRAVDLGLSDVLSARFGVEQALGPAWLRAGYGLRPSASPVQTSGANYIDGTAHTASLGVGVRFRDPWQLLASPVILEASGMLVVLPSREHAKIDPTDTVGSYTASGVVGVLGVALRYLYEESGAPEAAAEPVAAPPSPPAEAPPAEPPPPSPAPSRPGPLDS